MPSSFGAPARLLAAALMVTAVPSGVVLAQATAPASQPAAAPASQPDTDPVVATVDGQPIHLSTLKDAAANLPAAAHSMPPQTLYPMLLDQVIDGRALVIEAEKTGLSKDPTVQRQVKDAEDRALETAVLHKVVAPQITEEAVKARYEKDIANKPGAEEVHARHILVPDEATAQKIIGELDKGGDFAKLSTQYSKDPGAAKQGGDLGWFKKDEMVPAFADAAFALKDNQITQTPVHTQFGWHVIQVLGHRQAPAPSFDEAKEELRQKMIQQAVQDAVAHAKASVKVVKFNLDGSPMRATDNAEPPPAPPPTK